MENTVEKSLEATSSKDPVEGPTSGLLLGRSKEGEPVYFFPSMANRHGLVCGATGTGKTVTLQVLAEQYAALGATIFAPDVKGDLSGICEAGVSKPKIEERLGIMKLSDFRYESNPTVFWDLKGTTGHPLRASISELGPILLSHMLELNETQEGVLHITFRVADEQGLLLLDLKDLRQMLIWLSDNREDVSKQYGNVAPQTVAAIQRKLLVLEEAGGDRFFGEPAFQVMDLLQQDLSGRGIIHLLDASELIHSPRLYSAFLLWLLSELFENLDEVGDRPAPRMIFFFDEAHLLFDGASKGLLQKVEQVCRLIRSKGVGVFFVTQHPADVPDEVLAQLGNKVIHALRAYTPKERKAVASAAESFRENPSFSSEDVIAELGVGEALVSGLSEDGIPNVVQRTLIRPPGSKIGPAEEEHRAKVLKRSPFGSKYDTPIDRESAYEILLKRTKESAVTSEPTEKKSRGRQSIFESFAKSIVRSIGYRVGREIVRGVLGSLSRSGR